VRDWLLTALKLQGFSEWNSDYINEIPCKRGGMHHLIHDYMPIYNQLYPKEDIVENGEGALQFNDILSSSTYKEPYYAIKEDFWWSISDRVPHFTIGKAVPCMCCGQYKIKHSDMMVCNNCAEKYDLFPDDSDYPVCSCCGNTIYDGDWFDVQGDTLCGNCAEDEAFICDCCNEYYYNEHKHYDKKSGRYLCTTCYENIVEE
jgi:formylmethanofuran dehydrogenase subunit E